MSEEKKTPEFDEDCQFLEDIQKVKTANEPPVEEFIDLEKTEAAPAPAKKSQGRLERLAERQKQRDEQEEASLHGLTKFEDHAEARAEEPKDVPEETAAKAEPEAEAETEADSTKSPLQEHRDKKQARFDKRRFSDLRKTVFQMVEVGYEDTGITKGYDIFHLLAILVNITVCILYTFDYFEANYTSLLYVLEAVTVAFFAIDYLLRIWTAPLLYPTERTGVAIRKYVFSLWGIIDLISFLPFYLPFLPEGGAVFRLFRVVRIFRLFQVSRYSDSLGAITAVLKSKRSQLLTSIFLILTLMLAASLCLYDVENKVQPEVFSNALSGIWFACSTIFTIGYGDMTPITVAGKVLAMFITFLGVGLVAIPTGIISAGFVEQFQRIREQEDQAGEMDFHFIKVQMNYNDDWVGKKIMDLNLPQNVVVAVIQRGKSTIVPRGDVVIQEKDNLVLGAESTHDKEWDLELKEIVLKSKHPWNGQFIRDLDISRQTFIVLVRRKDRSMVPNGNLMLKEGDTVVLYSKKHIQDAVDIEL